MRAIVYYVVPILNQHWGDVSCLRVHYINFSVDLRYYVYMYLSWSGDYVSGDLVAILNYFQNGFHGLQMDPLRHRHMLIYNYGTRFIVITFKDSLAHKRKLILYHLRI